MTRGMGTPARAPGAPAGTPRRGRVETLLDALLAAGIFFAVVAEAIWALGSPSEHFDVRPQSRGSGPDDDFGEQWEYSDGLPPGLTGDDQLGHHALQQATLGVLAIVGVTAALAARGVLLRRRWPWAGIALTTASAVVGALVLGLPIAVTIAFALAVYSLAVERGWLAAGITAGAATISVIVAAALAGRDGSGFLTLLFILVAVLVPLLSAAATRSRRAYLREVEARLKQAEAEQAAQTERALADERVALARDLHDVLAHSLTVVNMQVGVASHLLATHPERAERALAEAKSAGAAAVDELRNTLALLRGDRGAGGEGDRAPVPGLDDIAGLVERVAATGLPVTLRWSVASGAPISSGVGLLAYRLVQEGLTNVVKHAGADAATEVRVSTEDGRLLVSVANAPGSAPPRAGAPGIGLEGLRSRVDALGGFFEAAPAPAGAGFIVQAALPQDQNPSGSPT